MDIALYALRLERALTAAQQERLFALVPPERAERLAALRDRARRDAPLCAYAALRLALRQLYGWQALPPIAPDERGKPCFPQHPEVCFNLSHTDGAVLVGVHDQPLGVDIERVRPVAARMLCRFSAADEKAFFAEWVRRESRVKHSGEGLAALYRPPACGERLHEVALFPGYAACVCTHTDAPLAVTLLPQDALLRDTDP